MIDWIKKTVYPPGIEKPGRLALFSVAGEVMSQVRADAEKAFNAHFPYLADDKKLDEHGESLLIPRLPNDAPEEYRNRVAAASFFLMRAGERAYVMEQLRERLGERFLVDEQFLSIHARVAELADDERVWILSLFDSLTDPNIYIELSELFHFAERMPPGERAGYAFCRREYDLFDGKICRNGRILRDGRTVLNEKIKIFRNGKTSRNGGANRAGCFFLPDTGIVRMPIARRSGTREALSVMCRPLFHEGISVSESFAAAMRRHHFHNGVYKRGGGIMRDGMVPVPLE